MAHPLQDDEEDRLEARMYQRLGREHGVTDITCPKCLHYRLRKAAPRLELPLSFGFSFGIHRFDWLKERMDSYARGGHRTWVTPADLEQLLHQSGHDPNHLDHIPAEAREQPIYIMHVAVPDVGTVPVICDGQHRATLALREGRALGAIVLPEHIEPKCRAQPGDWQARADICQAAGLLTWEMEIQYAVMRRGTKVIFGRIVHLAGVMDDATALFQPAVNGEKLGRGAEKLAPKGQGTALLTGDIAAYDEVSRKARFASHMSAGGKLVPAVPLRRSSLAPNPEMREVPPPARKHA
ncbi:MAG: hypothetical protein WCI67_09040 [Chloroflexales bacterium]